MYGYCKPQSHNKAPRTFVGVYYSLPSSFVDSVTIPYLLGQKGAAPSDYLGVLSAVVVSGLHKPVLVFLSSRPRTHGEDWTLLEGGVGVAAGLAAVALSLTSSC